MKSPQKIRLLSFLVPVLAFLVTGVIFTRCSNKVTGIVDDYVYALPYQPGTSHRVLQGYGGLLSHSHQAALDFKMPVGTKIFAARDGEVYAYKDDSNRGGPFVNKKWANYLIIKHPDGSFGCYWHLQVHGVLVKSGLVRRGQLIGLSGKTGFTFQPHLHFSVKRRLSYAMNSYVKTRFATAEGTFFLKRSSSYRAE